jgi:hypothetical protein
MKGVRPRIVSWASPLTARTLPAKAPRAPWFRIWTESTVPTPSATPNAESSQSMRPARSCAPSDFSK